jgi:hypothetical protein
MSIRQEKKEERQGKKDKNGLSLAISRPLRRSMQRLNRRMSDYLAAPICKESGHQYSKPGKQACY